MDYRQPVEALIPGAQGKVLGVLARAHTELTMRTVADLASISPQQASVVLARLIELGIVRRRDVPPAALVQLVAENLAGQAVTALAHLRHAALDRLVVLADNIRPTPASVIVYGSFARSQAGIDSDIDVLVVRPAAVPGDDDAWTDSLGIWRDQATRAIGNPVNLVEVTTDEVPGLVEHALLPREVPSLWRDIVEEGIVLCGASLTDLARAA